MLLLPPGQDVLPSLFLADLQSHQQQDPVISGVAHYVDRRRRPSRYEHYHEDQPTLTVLKQWDRLTLLNGILFRVTKDPLTKQNKFHFAMPESLKADALSGVHEHAGRQAQPHTRSLARTGMTWRKMSTIM